MQNQTRAPVAEGQTKSIQARQFPTSPNEMYAMFSNMFNNMFGGQNQNANSNANPNSDFQASDESSRASAFHENTGDFGTERTSSFSESREGNAPAVNTSGGPPAPPAPTAPAVENGGGEQSNRAGFENWANQFRQMFGNQNGDNFKSCFAENGFCSTSTRK